MKTLSKIRSLSLMLITLFVSGCTLVLEEPPKEMDASKYLESLEGVGFDEPYTYECEYGDITYQYNENTRVLKRAALPYLVKSDGDSILYFSDNMPKDLLIQPGHYVSAPSSRELPFGLCNKVVSLTHESGMYVMSTVSATQEEVFDVYNLDLCFDYTTSNSTEVMDSNEVRTRGLANDGTIYLIDYSALEGNSKSFHRSSLTKEELEYRIKHPTRTEDNKENGENQNGENQDEEDKEDEEGEEILDLGEDITVNEQETKEKTTPIVSFNSMDANINKFKPLNDLLSKLGLSGAFDLGLRKKETVSLKVEVSPDKDPKKTRRRTVTVGKTTLVLNVSITAEMDKGSAGKKKNGIENQNAAGQIYKQISQSLDNLRNESKKSLNAESIIMTSFILPTPVPVPMFIRIAPHLDFELGLTGSATLEYSFPETVIVAETVGDKDVTPEEEKHVPGSGKLSVPNASVIGFAKLTGGFEVLIGLGGGIKGVSAGLGGGFDATATLSLNITSMNLMEEAKQYQAKLDAYIGCDISFQPMARMFFGSNGLRFNLFNKFNLMQGKYGFYPRLGDDNWADVLVTNENGEYNMNYYGSFKYSSLGIDGNMNYKDYKAVMMIRYMDPTTQKYKYVDMEDQSLLSYLMSDMLYKFRKTIPYVNALDEVKLIPGYKSEDGIVLFHDNAITPQIDGSIQYKHKKLYLKKIETFINFITSEIAVEGYTYQLVDRFSIRGTTNIPEKWPKYGLEISATHKGYEVFPKTEIRLNGINVDGDYNISFKFNVPDDLDYGFTCEPFYYDTKMKKHYLREEKKEGLNNYWKTLSPNAKTEHVPSEGFTKRVKIPNNN